MEETTQFTLRINTEIWEKIKEIARQNKRSATKQVEFVLDEYIRKQNME